jgi:Zn-dependent protease
MIRLFQIIIILYSVILHEIAHGWVANRRGDPTAKLSGRITLNPLVHIDPVMTVILPLVLFFSGSPVIFGSAKPVPVNDNRLRNPKYDLPMVAFAGPAANLLLAMAGALIARLSVLANPLGGGIALTIGQLGLFTTFINLLLAFVNLIPIPPLDGFRILKILLPDEHKDIWNIMEKLGFLFILFILVFFGSSLINSLYNAADTITNILLSARSI